MPVPPEATVSVAGVNTTTGSSVSGGGLIVTVKVAEPEFPAASRAVAVQTLVVWDVTVGAVNVDPAKVPPFVQVTEGPLATATLSVADTVDVPVLPDSTVSVVGENATLGAVLSTTGGGVTLEDVLLLPPQADKKRRHKHTGTFFNITTMVTSTFALAQC